MEGQETRTCLSWAFPSDITPCKASSRQLALSSPMAFSGDLKGGLGTGSWAGCPWRGNTQMTTGRMEGECLLCNPISCLERWAVSPVVLCALRVQVISESGVSSRKTLIPLLSVLLSGHNFPSQLPKTPDQFSMCL